MLVHAVIEVPDDEIIDSRLSAQVSYMAKDSTGLCKKEVEGYLEKYVVIDKSKIEALATNVKEDDVILFKYPSDTEPDDVMLIKDVLRSEFPDNKVLGLTSDVELLIQNADEAVELLENMIAHIKITSNKPQLILT